MYLANRRADRIHWSLDVPPVKIYSGGAGVQANQVAWAREMDYGNDASLLYRDVGVSFPMHLSAILSGLVRN